MSELAVTDVDYFRQQYDSVATADQELNAPEFVQALRSAGIERFEQLGLPQRRQEKWRLTALKDFYEQSFIRAADTPIAADCIPAALSADSLRLVFVNGRFNTALSSKSLDELATAGIIVSNLAQVITQHHALIEPYLGRLTGLADHAFTALNDALFEDGAFLHIGAGKTLPQPVELIFWNTAEGQAIAAYPRNLIVIEQNAEATIVERYYGHGDYFCCPQSELVLAQDARCDYYKLQHESAQAHHLGTLRLQLAAGAAANCQLLSASGKLNRSDIYASLQGTGANCSVDGLTLLADGEVSNYYLTMEHAKPHGNSRQLFKSVLDGKARAVFDGLIKVDQDAQKTDASQTCRNLLLSKRAVAHANPRLEILADDVKCAHGSTVGFLDPDALFYLRARGIAEAQARAMLVYAFANEQIARIKLAPLRESLEQLLRERFYP